MYNSLRTLETRQTMVLSPITNDLQHNVNSFKIYGYISTAILSKINFILYLKNHTGICFVINENIYKMQRQLFHKIMTPEIKSILLNLGVGGNY